MKYCIPLLAFLYVLATSACNTTRIVKPLKAKEWAVGIDVGGPIIDFRSNKIPVPFSTINVARGLDSNMTVFGAVHLTSAFLGNVQLDFGVLRQFLAPKKGYIPGLSLAGSLQTMVNTTGGEFRLYPTIDVNFYWQYWKGKQHFAYVNWGSWFDFFVDAGGQPNQQVYFPVLSIGHTFENKTMRYTLEGKYMGWGIENGGTPVKFNGVGGYGSWGVYFSIHRKF